MAEGRLQKIERIEHHRRLLIVIGSLMVGGTETFLVRVLSNLAKQGWKIEVFTLAYQTGELAEVLRNLGVTITPMVSEEDQKKLSYLPKIIERLCRIYLCTTRLIKRLKQEKNIRKVEKINDENKKIGKNKNGDYPILHFYLPEAYVLGMIATLLARFPGPKGMSRRSLNHYQKKRPLVTWLEKKLHHYIDFATGNSRPVIEQLQQEGIPAEKLKLIYNGIELSHSPITSCTARNVIRQSLGIEENALVFIIVANLIPYKGHDDLLNALGLIKDQMKVLIEERIGEQIDELKKHTDAPWKLVCIGRNQGILEHLKQLAQSNEIDSNILWLGERKDVTEILQCADVGLLCSHEEGFSNAILECMAAGLPMVVTNVGGNAEAVIHNDTGYVVPAKDPKALGEAILEIISDKTRMLAFSHAGRQRVISQFTLEKCVSEHINFYNLLKNHS